MGRPTLPPFTLATATQKVRLAEDAWNTRDPQRVALAYTPDSRWRNRAELLRGRDAIEAFLTRKWRGELDYRLINEIWGCRDNRIAMRFASINDAPIAENERCYRWPLGRRPDDHPSPSGLEF